MRVRLPPLAPGIGKAGGAHRQRRLRWALPYCVSGLSRWAILLAMTTKRQENEIDRLLASIREQVATTMATLSQKDSREARKEAVAA